MVFIEGSSLSSFFAGPLSTFFRRKMIVVEELSLFEKQLLLINFDNKKEFENNFIALNSVLSVKTFFSFKYYVSSAYNCKD